MDLSRSLVALNQDSIVIAARDEPVELAGWRVGGVIPGIDRQPRKKLKPSAERLLGLLQRWRDEAVRAGRNITRIALAFQAGRDGFGLPRWLRARGVEADSARGAVALIPGAIAGRASRCALQPGARSSTQQGAPECSSAFKAVPGIRLGGAVSRLLAGNASAAGPRAQMQANDSM